LFPYPTLFRSYDALDPAALARAPLRDYGRAINPDPFEPVHREVGPGLVRLELGRRDPVGHHALGVELLPGPDRRVREQDLAAFHGNGRCGGAGWRWGGGRGGRHGHNRSRGPGWRRDHSAAVYGEERGAAGERGRPGP